MPFYATWSFLNAHFFIDIVSKLDKGLYFGMRSLGQLKEKNNALGGSSMVGVRRG